MLAFVGRYWLFAVLVWGGWVGASADDDVQRHAAKVDQILAGELAVPGGAAGGAPRIDDQAFLRRVSLDLIGELPSAGEVSAFALDSAADKRARLVERLLADRRYGRNWARYWRDVILSRRSDERALLSSNALVVFLIGQFNDNVPWDQIARQFVTATGDVRDTGSTALIMAQMADPSNVTAEVSRIFLGVQIQCAQCHDHPTDRWKRQQFHEMAAFFPRVAVRPKRDGEQRSFEVVSLRRPGGRRAPGATEPVKLEHYMPDLDDPTADGTLVKPIFFPTGQQLALGTSDAARRTALADWMTARTNRWFPKAIVNRLWGELIGRGFFEPLDDLGPDRQPLAPKTLDYLSSELAAHDYDLKWLFRVLTATEAYGRASRPRQDHSALPPFAANCPQRLRADQLFNSLASALDLGEGSAAGRGRYGRQAVLNSPRGQVNQVFGYDPSLPRDEISGSIPQALFLMNSAELGRAMSASGGSVLSRLLASSADDEALVTELYARCLAREPNAAEMKTCLEHVRTTASRANAFEDLLWALVNSTEFLHRK
jgi:hypothetical protein